MVTVLCSVKGHPYASSCTLRINSHVLKDTYFIITAANPSSNRNGKVMNYSSLKLLKAEPDDCFCSFSSAKQSLTGSRPYSKLYHHRKL